MPDSYTPDPKYGKMPPKVVTVERFEYMLNVLPPSKWYRGGYVEFFHVCERLSGDIVSWFARVGMHSSAVYYEFQDEATLTKAEVCAILEKETAKLGDTNTLVKP